MKNRHPAIFWMALFALLSFQLKFGLLMGDALDAYAVTQMPIDAERLLAALAQLNAAQLARFRDHFMWDSIFPLVYACFGWALVRHTQFGQRLPARCAIWLGLAAPADYAENTGWR